MSTLKKTSPFISKVYFRFISAILLCHYALLPFNVKAQLIAFPGAEGAGKFTSGGRGTVSSAPVVFEVTNLQDINAPGSLRYAVTVSGPTSRIIVFRVSGTIHLNSALFLNRNNTTIAGQTAPGQGICIADYPVYIGANNMIIRYLRFRLGDKNQNLGMVNGSGNDDTFGDNGNGRQKLIVDHCTASWSVDEDFTIYKGDSVTIQWCMISEPLNYSYHFETGDTDFEQHAFGGIWGGKHASFHHNLIAHVKGRAPRFDGIRNIAADTGDFRNNVIYNWSDYNTNGGEGGAYNIVNNYYKYGPNTLNTSASGVNRRSMILNPYKQSSPAIPYGKFFLAGNYSDNSIVVTNSNWLGAVFNGGSLVDSVNSKFVQPFDVVPVTTQSAEEAYQLVLSKAGAILPKRDTLDERIANDVRNRTGRLIDVQGGYPHGTPYSETINAWPAIDSVGGPVDSDHDGMPDLWEKQRGLNPGNASDLNGYISTAGYPNIENYINGDSIVASGVINTCINTRAIAATNSGLWQHARDTIYSSYLSPYYLSSTDTMNVVASVLDNEKYGTFNVSYSIAAGLRKDGTNKSFLSRSVTILPLNPGAIVSPVALRIYFTKAELDSLKAVDNSISSLGDLKIYKASPDNCNSTHVANAAVITATGSGVYGTYQNGYYIEFSTSSFGTFFLGSGSVVTAVNSVTAADVNFQLYPNPSDGNVRVIHPKATSNARLELYSINGDELQSFQLIRGSTDTVISVLSLPPGSYLLRFSDGSKKLSKLLIKK